MESTSELDESIWLTYFPDFSSRDKGIVTTFTKSLLNRCFALPLGKKFLFKSFYHRRQRIIYLDFLQLQTLDIQDLKSFYKRSPDQFIRSLTAAAHQGCILHQMDVEDGVVVRLINGISSETAFSNLIAGQIGKWMMLKGKVVRLGKIRPIIVSMTCICCKCGFKMQKDFKRDVDYSDVCGKLSCNSKTFRLEPKSIHMADWQKIRIREQRSITKEVCIAMKVFKKVNDRLWIA